MMQKPQTIEIYVSLLEEGTPTLRGTEAEVLDDGLYKILPTPHYDPEDEVWEFVPGTVVEGIKMEISGGRFALLARRPFVSRDEILAQHPGAALVDVAVNVRGDGANHAKKTQAIDLSNGFFKLLPSQNYDPFRDVWEYTPGSVVRVTRKKNNLDEDILLAFDQIREDRMNEEYAALMKQTDRPNA